VGGSCRDEGKYWLIVGLLLLIDFFFKRRDAPSTFTKHLDSLICCQGFSGAVAGGIGPRLLSSEIYRIQSNDCKRSTCFVNTLLISLATATQFYVQRWNYKKRIQCYASFSIILRFALGIQVKRCIILCPVTMVPMLRVTLLTLNY